MKTPDWASLERKLRRGKTLEQAAEEAGVDIAAATEYLAKKREHAAANGDDVLELAAAEAMHHGIQTLIRATKEKDGRLVGEGYGEGRFDRKESVDIDAAKTLLKFSIDARRLLVQKKKPAKDAAGAGQDDLFDREPGNWDLKEPS